MKVNEREKEEFIYEMVASPVGEIIIVAALKSDVCTVRRIFLPGDSGKAIEIVRKLYPKAARKTCPAIDEVADAIRQILAGNKIRLPLKVLDFGGCSKFQQKVLQQTARIPIGRASTYRNLAASVNIPAGARAVGNALGRNPFPIIIPCHRVVRSDGAIGGFTGGDGMKRIILDLEGVRLDNEQRVLSEYLS